MLQYCDLPLGYCKCCSRICITICFLLKGLMGEFRNPQQNIPAGPYTSSGTYTCLSLHIHYIIRYSCTAISSVRYSCMFIYPESNIPVCPHILSSIPLHARIPSDIPVGPYILSYISRHVRIHSDIPVRPHILSYTTRHARIRSDIPACPHILSYISLHVRIPSDVPVCPYILS